MRMGFVKRAQLQKVKQYIRLNGEVCEFKRDAKDAFGQPKKDENGDPIGEEVVASFKGVFHEEGTHFLLVVSDSGKVPQEPTSYLLALLEDTTELKEGDKFEIAGKEYKLETINDVGNFGTVATISLGLVSDGWRI